GLSAEPKWDSPAEAYAAFFADLDVAVKSLLDAKAADPEIDMVRFKKWDRSVFGGDYYKWVQLANTLRLRLAIRISDVDPAQAQAEALKALAPETKGVLDVNTGSFGVVNPSGNGYFTMS